MLPFARYNDGNYLHNYLHPLYFLLSPLIYFDDQVARLVWALINTAMAVFISYELCKMAKRCEYFILVIMFFFASLPFRNGIGNEQNQILILAFFVLSMRANSSWSKGLFGALSFVKYSFAGAWVGMFLSRDRNAVFWSGLLAMILTLLGAFWIFSGNFIVDFFGPFMVASRSVAPGHGDVLTIIDHIFGREFHFRSVVGLLLLLLNIIAVALVTRKSSDTLFILAIAGVSSLMFVTHLGYDGVFLLPALVFLIAKGGGVSLVGLGAIIYSWQIVKVLDVLNFRAHPWGWLVFQFLIYIVLFASLIITEKRKNAPLISLSFSTK